MSSDAILKKIKNIEIAKASDLVVQQFKTLLEAKELRPGDILPGEIELAKRFGVGRSHVREAIKLLQLYGIFKPVQGVGTIITDTGLASINEHITRMVRFTPQDYRELVDARSLIEPFTAYHAALNATDDELQRISDVFTGLDAQVEKGIFDASLECGFHLEIARAAHNRVLENAIAAILPGLIALLEEMDLTRKERYRTSQNEHRELYNALMARDAQAAEKAMRMHMINGGAHFSVHIAAAKKKDK